MVGQAEAAGEVQWARCSLSFQEEAEVAAGEHLHWALLLLACLVEAVHLWMAETARLQTAEEGALEAARVVLPQEEGAVEVQLKTALLDEMVEQRHQVEQAVSPDSY